MALTSARVNSKGFQDACLCYYLFGVTSSLRKMSFVLPPICDFSGVRAAIFLKIENILYILLRIA